MTDLEAAMKIRQRLVAHRRALHQNAEAGLELPVTREYVARQLTAMGIQPQPCGHGLTATLGQGSRCLLLRADMDALPIREESGESFACPSGSAHACGHDLHTAMLLGAARLLSSRGSALPGRVKLMFQPGEETFQGAMDMVENGILEGVDAAVALHVTTGRLPVGSLLYNATGTMMCSADGFRVELLGRGGHGAYPNLTVDPIHMGVRLCQALEGLPAREAAPGSIQVLTIGRFQAGTAANVIPDTAVIEGTLRCDTPEGRKRWLARISEIARGTARLWGGEARLTMLSRVPPLKCDGALTEQMLGYIRELDIPDTQMVPGIRAAASEDFAHIAQRVPSVFLYVSAGFPNDLGDIPLHNPKIRFHEDVLPLGTAMLAHCARRYLENGDTKRNRI